MKFLWIFFLLSVLAFAILLVYSLIRDIINHKKRMKRLNQWSQFHEQLMEWSKEIVDEDVRLDFINKCAKELINYSNHKLKVNILDDWNTDAEKLKIYTKWGKYIPSLTKEIRDKKLVQILNE